MIEIKQQELLKEANELLRSCHSICERSGADTNWEPLTRKISAALLRQHKFLYPKQVSEEEPSPQQEEWAQRIKDEMEQAVKRNGADYANGYCEGLEDMRYELQSQLSQALAKINAIEKEVKTWVTNWNQLDKLYREALQTLEDNKRELQQTIKDQEAEIEALKQLK